MYQYLTWGFVFMARLHEASRYVNVTHRRYWTVATGLGSYWQSKNASIVVSNNLGILCYFTQNLPSLYESNRRYSELGMPTGFM